MLIAEINENYVFKQVLNFFPMFFFFLVALGVNNE